MDVLGTGVMGCGFLGLFVEERMTMLMLKYGMWVCT